MEYLTASSSPPRRDSRPKPTGRTCAHRRHTSAYAQARNFTSRGGAEIGGPSTYEAPEMLMLNQWALAGDWTI